PGVPGNPLLSPTRLGYIHLCAGTWSTTAETNHRLEISPLASASLLVQPLTVRSLFFFHLHFACPKVTLHYFLFRLLLHFSGSRCDPAAGSTGVMGRWERPARSDRCNRAVRLDCVTGLFHWAV